MGERIAKQDTVEFLNGLCARKPEIRQVAAIVDTGHTVAEHAVRDVETRPFRNLCLVIGDTLNELDSVARHGLRHVGAAAHGECIDAPGPGPLGGALQHAVDAAPSDRNGDILPAVEFPGRRRGNDA